MTRLKDIAVQAGVSIMTVSKALRDAPDVSTATKAKIKLLAQQLGYVPDIIRAGTSNSHDPVCWVWRFRLLPIHFLPRLSWQLRSAQASSDTT
jgi:LacI family transcriptional regulator